LSPCFGSFYAYIGNCEISHRFGLLHGYFFHSLDIADAIIEDIDDLNILDVQVGVLGIVETLDIITETLIILLLDDLEGFGSRWTLICALEISNAHGTQLVPGVNGFFR
jgi:hypothetical protein